MATKKTVIQRKKIAPVKKKRVLTAAAKQKLCDRLATARAKKKPADYKNVAQSVLNLPEEDRYSFKNVKEWIAHSKDLVSDYNKVARSRATSSHDAQKASNAADHKQAYIRELNNYLKTGDYISYFSGQDENQKVIPRCTTMAFYPDGTPKRSCGVFYDDIVAVWTREMDEDMREYINYVPMESGTVAITDKQFDSSL